MDLLKKIKAPHLLKGSKAEDQAFLFLQDQGLLPVCRNYRCSFGELDIIMQDQDTLVIVEVRYRKNDIYGSAAESITRPKQARIIAATQHYLSRNKVQQPIRFDVITLSGADKINWIKNAFIT